MAKAKKEVKKAKKAIKEELIEEEPDNDLAAFEEAEPEEESLDEGV